MRPPPRSRPHTGGGWCSRCVLWPQNSTAAPSFVSRTMLSQHRCGQAVPAVQNGQQDRREQQERLHLSLRTLCCHFCTEKRASLWHPKRYTTLALGLYGLYGHLLRRASTPNMTEALLTGRGLSAHSATNSRVSRTTPRACANSASAVSTRFEVAA